MRMQEKIAARKLIGAILLCVCWIALTGCNQITELEDCASQLRFRMSKSEVTNLFKNFKFSEEAVEGCINYENAVKYNSSFPTNGFYPYATIMSCGPKSFGNLDALEFCYINFDTNGCLIFFKYTKDDGRPLYASPRSRKSTGRGQ